MERIISKLSGLIWVADGFQSGSVKMSSCHSLDWQILLYFLFLCCPGSSSPSPLSSTDILFWFPAALIKTMTKNYLAKKRLSSLNSQVRIYYRDSNNRLLVLGLPGHGLEAGTWKQELKRRAWRIYCLLSTASSVCFPRPPRNAHSILGPHTPTIKKMLHKYVYWQSD